MVCCGLWFRVSAVERVWHRFKSQVHNMDLESVTLSVGTRLCPYGIALRRAYEISFPSRSASVFVHRSNRTNTTTGGAHSVRENVHFLLSDGTLPQDGRRFSRRFRRPYQGPGQPGPRTFPLSSPQCLRRKGI